MHGFMHKREGIYVWDFAVYHDFTISFRGSIL